MATPFARAPLRNLLWVEGKDDRAVVESLMQAHAVPETFKVQAKDGVEELLSAFPIEVRAPRLGRFGIVVDANGDPRARWEAIRSALLSAGYTAVPEQPAAEGTVLNGGELHPVVGVWIMPDNGSPGALEDFAATLVPENDRLWARAARAVDSIPGDERRFPSGRRSKAHVHTWLAWQEYPGSPMGQAIGKGDLDAGAPIAARFVDWVRRLMLDEERDG